MYSLLLFAVVLGTILGTVAAFFPWLLARRGKVLGYGALTGGMTNLVLGFAVLIEYSRSGGGRVGLSEGEAVIVAGLIAPVLVSVVVAYVVAVRAREQ